MYLSDNELARAISSEKLICRPPPDKFDENSFDLHLDAVKHAKIWNIDKFKADQRKAGRHRPELCIGAYSLGDFGGDYLCEPPPCKSGRDDHLPLVSLRGDEVIVKPSGFLLWRTKEVIGTTNEAELLCFVNGKSTKARTGVLVHITAPTINGGWEGHVILEIANLGPFDVVLREDDAIAQLTVAQLSSKPRKDVRLDSNTYGQTSVDGRS